LELFMYEARLLRGYRVCWTLPKASLQRSLG
jgi:hypothetical protein